MFHTDIIGCVPHAHPIRLLHPFSHRLAPFQLTGIRETNDILEKICSRWVDHGGYQITKLLDRIQSSKAKPDALLSGAKRKAISPEEENANESLSNGAAEKKVKEEWSCALCQVSATSECGLNDHIQGKRHKSKEAALRAQRNSTNIGIGVFPKKVIKPSQKLLII